ncbi:MAG: hypothetical protein J6S95_02515 [Lachnospiraceae bacterium]|nr:hypothetical protein [Lachnospiraceae bacterium]
MSKVDSFVLKLDKLKEAGVKLLINYMPATPVQIAHKADILKKRYRPEFYYSDDGKISELNYICPA